MGEVGLRVRPAREDELPAVMGVLDAAMLDVDVERVRDRLAGNVLVAVEGGRLLGACVLEPGGARIHVEAIAVRPGRRGGGIGTALVEAAADGGRPLTAEFDEDVRPFYESLGFEVERIGGDRYRGSRRV